MALRIEVRAMLLLVDDNGRPLSMHRHLRMRDQWCGPHKGERLVGAEVPDTRSTRSTRCRKSKFLISGRVYLNHLSSFCVALYD